jgi:hypothetical protein
MARIRDIFRLHTARATGFDQYAPGEVAYITNGFRDNGVVGFVRARPNDSAYQFVGIVLSAFCEATVQIPPFVARGNGGSGLIVLEPLKSMTADELAYIAAFINTNIRWRFSWSRMATVDRIRDFEIPDSDSTIRYAVKDLLPQQSEPEKKTWTVEFKTFELAAIFQFAPGDYHNTSALPEGEIPLISCGEGDNGIAAFVEVPAEHIYDHKLTIAFNGMNTLTTKYHPYRFAAKDDVAVCNPLKPLRVSTLFFIQVMMGRERWRYNYYRKCFMEKLRRQSIELPASHGEIDEDCIATVVSGSRYWAYLEERLLSDK